MTREDRTTIGVKKSTKSKLDQFRAPGQCYDGFLCQMVELWQETHRSNKPKPQRQAKYSG